MLLNTKEKLSEAKILQLDFEEDQLVKSQNFLQMAQCIFFGHVIVHNEVHERNQQFVFAYILTNLVLSLLWTLGIRVVKMEQ